MQTEIVDPMRKREEFAVSLRNQKRKAIIETKRKRLPISMMRSNPQPQVDQQMEHPQTPLEEEELQLLYQLKEKLEAMLQNCFDEEEKKDGIHEISDEEKNAILIRKF